MNAAERTEYNLTATTLDSALGLIARTRLELKNCSRGFARKKRQIDERDKRILMLENFIDKHQLAIHLHEEETAVRIKARIDYEAGKSSS